MKHNRCYFPIFSSRLTASLDSFKHAISVNSIVFFDASPNVRSDLRQCSTFSLDVPGSRRSIPINFLHSQVVVYHCVSSGSSLVSTAHFTVLFFQIIVVSFDILYSYQPFVPKQEVVHCFFVLFTYCNLHLSSSTDPLIFFHVLVSIICSCDANTDIFSGVRDTFQAARVFFAILLWHFSLKLPLYQTLLFCSFFVLRSKFFSVFSILLFIQCNVLFQ